MGFTVISAVLPSSLEMQTLRDTQTHMSNKMKLNLLTYLIE